ncbi:hypothetical protein [Sulfurimonas sp.]|uniref:hypothetical protein n=2 Tax=Sulfurimonas sp. TaxID=2022749 RepID=UPI0026342DA6|nr:hypothetical protein [Sulfurimonas sp.]
MLTPNLKKRLEAVPQMGYMELVAFRQEVANSWNDTQTNCFCYEIIEKRMEALDISAAALIENNEPLSLNDFDGVER